MSRYFELGDLFFRVLRGGAYGVNEQFVVFCHRNNWGPSGSGYDGNFGIRLVRNVGRDGGKENL